MNKIPRLYLLIALLTYPLVEAFLLLLLAIFSPTQ
jgi:hypothetical protein